MLLTEDGSKWADATLEQVCRQIFHWLKPPLVEGPWLRFQGIGDDALRHLLTKNGWKSTRPRDYQKILRLQREVAVALLRGDFVFHHVDADVVFGMATSENLERFEVVIRTRVRDIVRGHIRGSEDRVKEVMSRLILVAPYYSIEGWLFANHIEPSTLDRTSQPKDLLSINRGEYPDLARTLPVAALCGLQTSFMDTLLHAGACGSLITRLRAHWPSWVRAEYHLQ